MGGQGDVFIWWGLEALAKHRASRRQLGERLYSAGEVADRLKITSARLRQLVRAGVAESWVVSGVHVFTSSQLATLMAKRGVL